MNTLAKALMVTTSIAVILLMDGCSNKRRDLLCKKDLNAILLASRELLAAAATGELRLGVYEFEREPHSPEIARFPQVIRELKPSYVVIESEDYLTIHFGGGFDHFGLMVYSRDFKEPYPGFSYGDTKITDGLWYYDDGYRDYAPRYKRKIDAWIEARVKSPESPGGNE